MLKRKRASLWRCGVCKYEVRTEPGKDMNQRPCAKPSCNGKLEYRGGCFVEEGCPAFKVINDFYLVGAINAVKTNLDPVSFHPKNRMRNK